MLIDYMFSLCHGIRADMQTDEAKMLLIDADISCLVGIAHKILIISTALYCVYIVSYARTPMALYV